MIWVTLVLIYTNVSTEVISVVAVLGEYNMYGVLSCCNFLLQCTVVS